MQLKHKIFSKDMQFVYFDKHFWYCGAEIVVKVQYECGNYINRVKLYY